jgi:hypothetical protein
MKEKIKDVVKYILREYPYKSELSASRLTKILYLVDWKNVLEMDAQLTDAKWYFNHYGPYVDDFIEMAEEDDDIEITSESTMFGGKKKLVKLSKKFNKNLTIDPKEKTLIDFVIDATKLKNYEDFIKLVYSTYPVLTSSKYSQLDLLSSAHRYKEILADKT